jgi:hypothetical protein
MNCPRCSSHPAYELRYCKENNGAGYQCPVCLGFPPEESWIRHDDQRLRNVNLLKLPRWQYQAPPDPRQKDLFRAGPTDGLF